MRMGMAPARTWRDQRRHGHDAGFAPGVSGGRWGAAGGCAPVASRDMGQN